jgi:hypothetical protein
MQPGSTNSMMKSPQARRSDDPVVTGGPVLDCSPHGRVAKSRVHALAVVILDVLEKEPPKVLLVDRDDVVDEFAPDRPDSAFRRPVLPRRAECRQTGDEVGCVGDEDSDPEAF